MQGKWSEFTYSWCILRAAYLLNYKWNDHLPSSAQVFDVTDWYRVANMLSESKVLSSNPSERDLLK
jgi:hypothetical protein